MRATVREQWRVSPNVTSEEYFLIEHEIEEKEVGVQGDGFLIQHGQAWMVVGPAYVQ